MYFQSPPGLSGGMRLRIEYNPYCSVYLWVRRTKSQDVYSLEVLSLVSEFGNIENNKFLL